MALRRDGDEDRDFTAMSHRGVRTPSHDLSRILHASSVPQRPGGFLMRGGIGVVTGGFDGGITWANDSFLKLSGYSAAEIAARGLDWHALTPPEWQGEDRARFAAARISGFATVYEKQLWRADGSRWPVIVAFTLGDSGAATVFVIDLTGSKLSDAARGDAETKYARFFENADVAFWTADAAGRVLFTSRYLVERLGDPTLLNASTRLSLIHPVDRSIAVKARRRARAHHEPYDIEIRVCMADTKVYRWVRLQAYPDFDAQGRIAGWYGTAEDIDDRRRATIALAESESRFRQLSDDMPVMVWLTDVDNQTTYLSRRWCEFTGQTEADGLARGWLEAVVEADRPRFDAINHLFATRKFFKLDFRLGRADGEQRWMMSSGQPRHAPDGTYLGYVGIVTDIHARKLAERDIGAMQMRLSRALDGTGVRVWEWDGLTDTVMISGGAGTSGASNVDVAYRTVDYRATIHTDDHARLDAAMDAYIAGHSPKFEVEVRVRTYDQRWIWMLDRGMASARDKDGRATHVVGTLTNIDDRKRAEARLLWTINHDALTSLASRTLIQACLDTALASGSRCALVLLDIDDFKAVNDIHGHGAGDALLRVLADRLRAFAEPHETPGRLGGDEFTLMIADCGDPAAIMTRIDGLRAVLDAPFDHDGYQLTCRSSIGVAIGPDHGGETSALLKSADIAMYSAKHSGRGGIALFTPALGASVGRDVSRVAALREALDAGRIVACYEPIVRLSDDSVQGFEASARIIDSDGDVIDAHDSFIRVNPELAIRLGDMLMDRVLSDFAGWRDAGLVCRFIALKVAQPELQRCDYAERLLARLAAHAVPPDCLRIAVLELGSTSCRGNDRSEATLDRLCRGGIGIALDRFGAAATSLSQLTRLTWSAIKIDPQFIGGVAEPDRDQTIVRAMTGLATSFGLRSVALGVETAEQAARLLELGCTYGQGSYFGRPRDAATTLATFGR